MSKIEKWETRLTGKWILVNKKIQGDQTCNRIEALIKSHLKEIARDSSGWLALYVDPSDGRFWELTYPEGELQGGGPPELRSVTLEEARRRYGESISLQ